MKRLALLLSLLVLVGCGPAYTVKQLDARFSESGNATYVAEGNRISRKSMAGGTHIDEKGLQINPVAEVSPDGKLVILYLSLVNLTDRDSHLGAPNSIGRPEAIAFLIDGELLSVKLRGDMRYADVIHRNAQTRGASIGIQETGMGVITAADLRRIVNAQSLVVRVDGSRRSHTYENADIDAAFRANLKAFAERFAIYTPKPTR